MTDRAPDCECCVGVGASSSSSFLRRQRATKRPPLTEEPIEDGENENEIESERTLLNSTLFKAFDTHVSDLNAARLRRIESLSFKSALEEDGEGEVNEDATQDDIDGLGVWMPGDEFQGDVNYRTLQKLLTRVDQRGFERCARTKLLRVRHDLRIASLHFARLGLHNNSNFTLLSSRRQRVSSTAVAGRPSGRPSCESTVGIRATQKF